MRGGSWRPRSAAPARRGCRRAGRPAPDQRCGRSRRTPVTASGRGEGEEPTGWPAGRSPRRRLTRAHHDSRSRGRACPPTTSGSPTPARRGRQGDPARVGLDPGRRNPRPRGASTASDACPHPDVHEPLQPVRADRRSGAAAPVARGRRRRGVGRRPGPRHPASGTAAGSPRAPTRWSCWAGGWTGAAATTRPGPRSATTRDRPRLGLPALHRPPARRGARSATGRRRTPRGRGLAAVAVDAVCRWAFDALPVDRIELCHAVENTGVGPGRREGRLHPRGPAAALLPLRRRREARRADLGRASPSIPRPCRLTAPSAERARRSEGDGEALRAGPAQGGGDRLGASARAPSPPGRRRVTKRCQRVDRRTMPCPPGMVKRATRAAARRARTANSADRRRGTQRSPRPCRIATVCPAQVHHRLAGRRPRGERADGGDRRLPAGAQDGPAAHGVAHQHDRGRRCRARCAAASTAQRTSWNASAASPFQPATR